MPFLLNKQLIPYSVENIPNAKTLGVALGNGPTPIEIVVVETNIQPTIPQIREAWKNRQASRAAPVLLVVNTLDISAICGPTGENPPILTNVDKSTIEKLCNTVLTEPDRHSALRFLRSVLENIESHMPGIRNEGLMSANEIDVWLRNNRGRSESKRKSIYIRDKRGEDLVVSLGYKIKSTTGNSSILISKSNKLALAVFLDRNESPDIANERFSNNSPITYALTKAGQENLKYVIITSGPSIRIYPTANVVGVGNRGSTETFFELHLDLVKDDTVSLLWDIFSAEAISTDGTFQTILDNSKRYSSRLGERLRDRVYHDVIPDLAKGLVKSQNFQNPTQQDLDKTYHMALTLLFRILFIAYAEDKDLLPYKTNEIYRNNSFKEKAIELVQILKNETGFDSNSYSHWEDAIRLFNAVNNGSSELGVPRYNGGLFSDKAELSSSGSKLQNLKLQNDLFGPILMKVLVDEDENGNIGPVDFRSLGVREFGTIYEGLLESELSIAETNLTVDKKGAYKPGNGTEPQVRSGDVYIHNKSGSRKASGSYFTKSFAVNHLLDHSLEPALDEHITRLGTLDSVDAAKAFFDFKVADISMGSGHFLVAAVDRIEKRLLQYLVERPLPAVKNELARLRSSAIESLDEYQLADGIEIEDANLLRRQIVRRCIYGVDLNPIAVELARVSLWIHTFVPGLPLSMLDHHLVEGNSLIGIGTLEEAQELVSTISAPVGANLFNDIIEKIVRTADQSMAKVAHLADADNAEIQAARGALEEARLSLVPLRAMFDILAASRLDAGFAKEVSLNVFGWQDNDKREEIRDSNLYSRTIEVMGGVEPFHFPVAFPDVFARARAGFDVILGNPPWKEVVHKEDSFWSRFFPGFSRKTQREREILTYKYRNERQDLYRVFQKEVKDNALVRLALVNGPYPGIGKADPDVYRAFVWRFWYLVNHDGRIGVVLPRTLWNGSSSVDFRKAVLHQGEIEDLTFLKNTKEWVFKDVTTQYTIALSSIRKTVHGGGHVQFRGTYSSYLEYASAVANPPCVATTQEIISWTANAMIPLRKEKTAVDIFRQMKKHPSLTSQALSFVASNFLVLPHRELDATNDKPLMDFVAEPPETYWPVFKGESIDIWEPDRGNDKYYAWVNPDNIVHHLQRKRLRSSNNKNSAFSKFSKQTIENLKTLPCLNHRIVMRLISRATEPRTIRCALVPPKTVLQNGAPYLLFVDGSPKDEAYVLGILSSIPLDWFAKTVVELNVNHHHIDTMPVPRVSSEHSLMQRIISLSGRLASPDERFAEWANAVGVEYGPLEQNEKEDMIHELDAAVAHLYGLSQSQLRHIFETFHIGWDYSHRLQETLKHYESLKGKS